jgi:hypothetical protein
VGRASGWETNILCEPLVDIFAKKLHNICRDQVNLKEERCTFEECFGSRRISQRGMSNSYAAFAAVERDPEGEGP